MTPNALAQLSKTEDAHKYDHGHALVLSGGVGKGGAARLAARGALRVGAGLVTIGCPPAALLEHATQLNAVMCRRIEDAAALAALLTDSRLTALCLGPGLGLGAAEKARVAAALQADRTTVLDADALTHLSQDADLFRLLHPKVVLTPHLGEFTRLFPDLEAPAAAAMRAGCTVLLKGPVTQIAGPDGRCQSVVSTGKAAAPWLATAGSGDVLAGFITGLLARGLTPLDAAETGAWLHAECARHFGPGLIAEDLPEVVPAVFRRYGV